MREKKNSENRRPSLPLTNAEDLKDYKTVDIRRSLFKTIVIIGILGLLFSFIFYMILKSLPDFEF